MKKILLICITSILFMGCSSREAFYVNKQGEYPEKEKINSVYTGDSIYKRYDYIAISGANLLNYYNEKVGFSEIEINSKDTFTAIKNDDYIMYCSNERIFKQIGTNDFVCLRDKNNDNKFDEFSNQYAIVWNKLSKELPYEIKDILVKSGFKYEINYNGISNNTIHLEYKEYINDIARPSFNQNLQYEFKNQKINIRYKDVKIEVYEADNNRIKYKILN